MLSNYTNTFFPICSCVLSIFLCVLYFNRKNIKNMETDIYSTLIKVGLVESTFYVLLTVLVDFIYSDQLGLLFKILNKLLGIVYILWMAVLLYYVIVISTNDEKQRTKSKKIISIITPVFSFVLLLLPIQLWFDPIKYQSNSYGIAMDYLYIVISFYIVIMAYIIFKNRKKEQLKQKYIPMYVLFSLLTISMIIRLVDPIFNVTSNVLSLVLLVMYHTIENPDLKMVEQLELAKDQADKANRAKTDFLSSMSHEIRTPLNAIVGFSDYIITSSNLDEAKENAKDIVNASQTLLEIVNGILDISKIEAGKLEIVNVKYPAKTSFESLAKLITPKMQEKGLDFTYYIAPDIPETLFGDHANIKKVVTNLLSNAYKYTDKGFVRYEVNCINSADTTKLIITVEDSGRGIKQESVDKLFTKFQRLDEDRNTTIEGTGLGLAITKQLIELMGGKILVHTVYGEGSKFTVMLTQRIETTPVTIKEKEVKTTLDLRGKKILIVDDNALNIKVANKILERFNADNVESLDSGFACLDKINAGNIYDIILMDDMMPKMSGVETFQKLKAIPGFDQPVVILTANAITGMKEKYLKEGFDDYLAKPIEKEELIRVCNEIFDKNSEKPALVHPEESTEAEVIEILETTEELPVITEEIASQNTKTPEDYLKENNVDVSKALEFLGDMEMYNMTMADFLSEVETKWQRIISYKDSNDMANYAIEVHSLKSDAKYLGFMFLADVAYEHELKSKENDSTFVNSNFTRLEEVYSKALTIAKTYKEMTN